MYWETDSFILKNHSLVEVRENQNFIRVSHIASSHPDPEKREKKIRFRVNNAGANPRVHFYAFQFMPNNIFDIYQRLKGFSNMASQSIFKFHKWSNFFLSNRKLGDEFRYVFDRKYVQRFMGNTLDRPQLLLKRNFVRDTVFNEEVVNAGNEFAHIQERAQMQAKEMDYGMHQQRIAGGVQDMMYKDRGYLGGGGGGYSGRGQGDHFNYNQHMSIEQLLVANDNLYKSFQNFLRYSAHTSVNLHPDGEGYCEVTLDTALYSTALIVAVDDKSATQQVLALEDMAEEDIEKRTLVLDQPLDVDKYYNETRNCARVIDGETVTIDDITSTEHMIIDTIDKVKKVQDEIVRILGKSKCNEDLEFLLKWNTFDEEEKHKKYSNFCCHETNLFIYFKDREYFEGVVRPFIENKMEKSFIDFWLLGDYARIEHFKGVSMLGELNALEKCLLVHAIRESDPNSAKEIANLMRMDAEKNDYTADQKNKIFDTVLNLNILNKGDQIDLECLVKDKCDYEEDKYSR